MKSVAIVAMGSSNQEWFRRVYRGDSPEFFERVINERFAAAGHDIGFQGEEVRALQTIAQKAAQRKLLQEIGPPFDEVWGVNHMGKMLRKSERKGDCGLDLIIAMDDLRVERERYGPMLTGDVPIVTSTAYPEFNCIEYPIREVVAFLHKPVAEHVVDRVLEILDRSTARVSEKVKNDLRKWAHNSSTVNYMGTYIRNSVTAAVCLAAYRGFDRIHLFGADFYYDDGSAKSEEARANCEFWLGFCQALGIHIDVSKGSTTLDMNKPRKLYGYAQQPRLPFNKEFDYDTASGKLVPTGDAGKGPQAQAMDKNALQ